MTKRSDITGTIELVEVVYKDEVGNFSGRLGHYDQIEEALDGFARYRVEYAREPVMDGEEGEQGPFEMHYRQPFHEGEHEKVAGRNVWGWDGDKENPTLHPSFGTGDLEDGWTVHLFLRDGEIDPCSDMALEVR